MTWTFSPRSPVCFQHRVYQHDGCYLSSPRNPTPPPGSCQTCGPVRGARPGSSAMWNLTLCCGGTLGPRWESARGVETVGVRLIQSDFQSQMRLKMRLPAWFFSYKQLIKKNDKFMYLHFVSKRSFSSSFKSLLTSRSPRVKAGNTFPDVHDAACTVHT